MQYKAAFSFAEYEDRAFVTNVVKDYSDLNDVYIGQAMRRIVEESLNLKTGFAKKCAWRLYSKNAYLEEILDGVFSKLAKAHKENRFYASEEPLIKSFRNWLNVENAEEPCYFVFEEIKDIWKEVEDILRANIKELKADEEANHSQILDLEINIRNGARLLESLNPEDTSDVFSFPLENVVALVMENWVFIKETELPYRMLRKVCKLCRTGFFDAPPLVRFCAGRRFAEGRMTVLRCIDDLCLEAEEKKKQMGGGEGREGDLQ